MWQLCIESPASDNIILLHEVIVVSTITPVTVISSTFNYTDHRDNERFSTDPEWYLRLVSIICEHDT